ncbi:MAG: ABC transporter substrate-binding protein [Actinomycetota bacterium]
MQFRTQDHLRPLLLVMALLLAACSDGDTADTDVAASPSASASASGVGDDGDPVESDDAAADDGAGQNDEAADGAAAAETEPAETEPADLSVGVPFGLVQIATLGGVSAAPELDGLAAATTVPIATPDELRTGFATGELDVAIMPTNVAAILANREVDVRLIGVVDAQLLQVVGPAGAGWSEIEGATVDLPFPGDIADVLFRSLATDNGVDLDTVEIRYGTSLPDLVAAAAAGEVTFAVLPEHFASAAAAQATAAGQDLAPVIDLQDAWSASTGGDRLPQIAVVATGSLVDERPDVIEALQASSGAAVGRTADDPEVAAAMLAEATGLPAPLVTGVVGSLDLAYRSVPEARTDLDLLFSQLLDDSPEGLAGGLPPEEFFTG